MRVLLPLLILLVLAGCADGALTAGPTRPVEDAAGVVLAVETGEPNGSFWVLRVVPDSNAYVPLDLPERFQKDGLAVTFSGDVLPIPPGVRQYAPNIDLAAITERRP